MTRFTGVLAMGIIAGCTSKPDKPLVLGQGLAQLRMVGSCSELESHLRAQAIEEMNRQLEQNLESALKGSGICFMEGDVAFPASNGTAGASGAREATQYSTTNNQVAGVDEADFIKNDGRYFYLATHGELQILDVWPPEQAHVISHFKIEGQVSKLFVSSNRAAVYSSLEPATGSGAGSPWRWRPGACTSGYDCDVTGDGRPAKLTVLDISDPTRPVLLRELEFTGSLINARRVGDAIYTVVSTPEVQFPEVAYWPADVPFCGDLARLGLDVLRAKFDALRAHNEGVILRAPLSAWLPSVSDTVYAGGGSHTWTSASGDCTGFYESQVDDGKSFLTVAGFHLTSDAPPSLSSIVGRPGAVYATGDSLYVAARHQPVLGQGWFFDVDQVREATSVHKFHLAGAQVTYAGSAAVKGRVLNQFSMDEYEGALRIATTSGHLPSPEVHSTLSVLVQGSGALDLVGVLDGLAPGEDIRSARFDGAKGFVVTFKKTDPLFVIDLSRPEQPEIAGELKIPGFSTYLHLMDPTHLLSIGYDAEDMGDFAWFAGVQLQIFDIGDATSPSLTQRTLIGTRGTSSEALTNHLAFTYFAPKNLLAIPMVVCEGGSGGTFGDQLTFSGLMVFDATVAGGFTYRGGIAHMPSEPVGACSNWWSQAGSPVKRSVIMDDYVFSVSDDVVKADALGNLGVDVAVVPLAAAP
jgi:hypothetical protein